MFKDKSKLLWAWRLQCMLVLLWILWTSSFPILAAVTMKSRRFIMWTIPYYITETILHEEAWNEGICNSYWKIWGRKGDTLSCMNTVTEWGKSIAKSLSVGPKLACVGIPVWEQRWSLWGWIHQILQLKWMLWS